MFKNYFIVALRSIRRNLSYAVLNIFGLTLGIASCLVIFLVVKNELSYDTFYNKADRTYRVTLNAIDFNSNISMAVVPAMRTDFPELEQVTQAWYERNGTIKIGNARFAEKKYAYVDQNYTKVFNQEWLAGNPNTALVKPNAIVVTQSTAKKYFGNKNPIGQIVELSDELGKRKLEVTGLIKDVHGNTSLPADFFVSFESLKEVFKGMMGNFWAIGGGSFAYIVIPKNYSIHQLESKIPQFIKKNWGPEIAKAARMPLQPLKDVHFDQRYINNITTPVSRETYWALAGVALLIIITACINFINLATAQAIRRAKEVGVRKVLGATRSQLIRQFISETTVLVLLALVMGITIAGLFLQGAEKILDIQINASQLAEPAVAGWIAALTILVILIAGLYPAFIQSAFRPVDSLKRNTKIALGGLSLRKGLVIAQFSITQMMIVGTLVVSYQMDFFKNRDLGFNKEAVISVGIPKETQREALRQQLQNNPGVKEFSFSSGAPAYNSQFTSLRAPESGLLKDDVTEVKYIDEKYTAMFQLKMLAGTPIVKKNQTDTLHNVVVNETLIHKLNIQDPRQAIGKNIILNGNQNTTIMGVVQDFQSESKHKKIRPCVLEYQQGGFYMASIRLQPAGMHNTIERIDRSWSALFPDDLFEYEFLDSHIANLYKQEQKVYTAFTLFSFIAILIGCLGLYGLISFAASQRIKEVGIRKVLGASLLSIVSLFSTEFFVLIGIAFLIAAPVGYYVMHTWLQNFAYHIDLGAVTFIIAIAISLLIAGITISYQAVRAALVNPINSLRSE